METTNWNAIIMHQSDKAKLLNGKVVKGYVHDVNLFGEFSLNFAKRRKII